MPTPDYILASVLPRPRDLIYLCNAAVGVAINRGHGRVEAEDAKAAQDGYSQFAFEALLVENGITLGEFEAVLLEFLSVSPYLTKDEIFQLLEHAGVTEMKAEQVIARLKAISFLGIETKPGTFEYPEVGGHPKRQRSSPARTHLQTGERAIAYIRRSAHSSR